MIKALTFDIFGTLLSYDKNCTWIAKYAEEIQEINTGRKPYITLDLIFNACSANLTDLEIRPGVLEALELLGKSYILVPLSNANSSRTLLNIITKHFDFPWTLIIDLSPLRAYKPDPTIYRWAASRLLLRPDQILHVASHPFDLRAARLEDFKTGYIHWEGYANPVTSNEFDFQTPTMIQLAHEIIERDL